MLDTLGNPIGMLQACTMSERHERELVYVDKVLYQEIKPADLSGEWVYNKPFFIILNVAVGGNYVGFPTSETPFPQSMIIDYVRVYKAQ